MEKMEIEKRIADFQLKGDIDEIITDYLDIVIRNIQDKKQNSNLSYRTLSYMTGIPHSRFSHFDKAVENEEAIPCNSIKTIMAYALAVGIEIEEIFIDENNRLKTIKELIKKISVTDKQEVMLMLLEDVPHFVDNRLEKISQKYYADSYFAMIFWKNNIELREKTVDIMSTYEPITIKQNNIEDLIRNEEIYYTSYEELYEIKYVFGIKYVDVFFSDGIEQGKKKINTTVFFDQLVNSYNKN